MKIEILGPGCPKCEKLASNAEDAVKELGLDIEIKKIKDIQEIMKYGVLLTPGLVLNGEVVSSGKVLNTREIKKKIEDIM